MDVVTHESHSIPQPDRRARPSVSERNAFAEQPGLLTQTFTNLVTYSKTPSLTHGQGLRQRRHHVSRLELDSVHHFSHHLQYFRSAARVTEIPRKLSIPRRWKASFTSACPNQSPSSLPNSPVSTTLLATPFPVTISTFSSFQPKVRSPTIQDQSHLLPYLFPHKKGCYSLGPEPTQQLNETHVFPLFPLQGRIAFQAESWI